MISTWSSVRGRLRGSITSVVEHSLWEGGELVFAVPLAVQRPCSIC